MRCTSSAFPDGSGPCGLETGHAGNHRLALPVKTERLDPITERLIDKAIDAGIAWEEIDHPAADRPVENEKSNFTSRIIGLPLKGQQQEPELPHPVPLQAGRLLDALIAERVMGLVKCRGEFCTFDHCYAQADTPDMGGELREYSTRVEEAFEVAEWMRALGWVYLTVQSFAPDTDRPQWDDATMKVEWWAEFSRYRSPVEVSGGGDTAPHAICIAALRAIGEVR